MFVYLSVHVLKNANTYHAKKWFILLFNNLMKILSV